MRRAQESPELGAAWVLSNVVYVSSRLEDSKTPALRQRLEQMLSESPPIGSGSLLVLSALAVKDRTLALERLSDLVRAITQTDTPIAPRFFWIKHNIYADSILEEPAFVELRSQLGYRDRIR